MQRYGSAPAGVWSAPGRANLIGEHTDYNNGFVLPFAIDDRTWCAARPNHTGTLRVASTAQPTEHAVAIADLDAAIFEGWSGYALGVAWALGKMGHDLTAAPGVDVLIDSTVPLGAGLSSSAALESAVAVALNDLWDLNLDRMTLAQVGQLAENGAIGAPTGIMDQVASLFGEADHAVLLDCASLQTTSVPLHLVANGLSLLVLDSKVSTLTPTAAMPRVDRHAKRAHSRWVWPSCATLPSRILTGRETSWTTRRSGGCATSSPKTTAS